MGRHFYRSRLVPAALVLCSGGTALPVSGQEQVTADQVVNAFEDSYGVKPGERRNHIKGVCALGEFIGTREAAAYSRSPLFSGKPIPVVFRSPAYAVSFSRRIQGK